MSDGITGQVGGGAAEFYEAFFVPALFRSWTAPLLDEAGVVPGQRVLDVGCGTGVLARAALERVQPGGSVSGADPNPGMLAVARREAPRIDWRLAQAESLPFEDGAFDAVVSQFALMFFADREAALREMGRVTRSAGRIAVAVWDSLENTPGYAAMTVLLARLFGDRIADELRAPYALGDARQLRSLFEAAGLADVRVEVREGTARFPSIDAWIEMDVKGWTLAELLDDEQFERLRRESRREMARFARADGSVAFRSPALFATARTP